MTWGRRGAVPGEVHGMEANGFRPGAWLAGVVAAGVVTSHALAYRLTQAAGTRNDSTTGAGHRYWVYFVVLAVAGLIAGLAAFALQRVRAGAGADRSFNRFFGSTFARLILWQAGAFLLLEGTERLLSGGDLVSLAQEPAIAMGLIVQAVVAALGALLMILLATAVDRIVEYITRTLPETHEVETSWVLDHPFLPRLAPAASGRTLRGPPVSV